MMKCLTPYREIHDRYGTSYYRYRIGLKGSTAQIFYNTYTNNKWYIAYCRMDGSTENSIFGGIVFDTAEEAKQYVDQKLVEEGYILLTEEQYEKFAILI